MNMEPGLTFGIDHDRLYYLCEQNPSTLAPFLNLNRNTRAIALSLFAKADREMLSAFPSFLPSVNKDSITDNNALSIFMRLINHLHDEAKFLNCDPIRDPALSSLGRIEWECGQYQHLVNEVAKRMAIAKTEDFNKFVEAVANARGIVLPADTNHKEFWEGIKQDAEAIKAITKLNLFNKGMRFLPPDISLLTSLTNLYLAKNQIREIPVELASLPHLKILDISGNQIQALPENLPLPISWRTSS